MDDFLNSHEVRCDWITTRSLWSEYKKYCKNHNIENATHEEAVKAFVESRQSQQRWDDITSRVNYDYQYVTGLGYNVFFVALTGSQNYGLAYEKSDIDTKAIVIPSFKDMVMHKKPVSETIVLPTNEHIDIKDVRLYIDLLKRDSPQWLETVFTPWNYVSFRYKKYWDILESVKHILIRSDEEKFYNVCKGQIMQKVKDMTHIRPGNEYDMAHFGYDTKCCYHIHRFAELAQRYHDFPQMDYGQMLWSEQRDYILKIKRGQVPKDIAVKEALDKADKYIPIIEKWSDEAPEKHTEFSFSMLDDALYGVLKYATKEEFEDETE